MAIKSVQLVTASLPSTIKGYKLTLEHDGGNSKSLPAKYASKIQDSWSPAKLAQYLEGPSNDDMAFEGYDVVLKLNGQSYYLVGGEWEAS